MTLIFKLLLTIANATGSIEDLLMAVNHLDRAKVANIKPILQAEIKILSQFSQNLAQKSLNHPAGKVKFSFGLSPYDKKNEWTLDSKDYYEDASLDMSTFVVKDNILYKMSNDKGTESDWFSKIELKSLNNLPN